MRVKALYAPTGRFTASRAGPDGSTSNKSSYKSLTDGMLRPYALTCLMETSHDTRPALLALGFRAGTSVRWGVTMSQHDLQWLLFIPFGFAVAFMAWVFWNLCKQSRR